MRRFLVLWAATSAIGLLGQACATTIISGPKQSKQNSDSRGATTSKHICSELLQACEAGCVSQLIVPPTSNEFGCDSIRERCAGYAPASAIPMDPELLDFFDCPSSPTDQDDMDSLEVNPNIETDQNNMPVSSCIYNETELRSLERITDKFNLQACFPEMSRVTEQITFEDFTDVWGSIIGFTDMLTSASNLRELSVLKADHASIERLTMWLTQEGVKLDTVKLLQLDATAVPIVAFCPNVESISILNYNHVAEGAKNDLGYPLHDEPNPDLGLFVDIVRSLGATTKHLKHFDMLADWSQQHINLLHQHLPNLTTIGLMAASYKTPDMSVISALRKFAHLKIVSITEPQYSLDDVQETTLNQWRTQAMYYIPDVQIRLVGGNWDDVPLYDINEAMDKWGWCGVYPCHREFHGWLYEEAHHEL